MGRELHFVEPLCPAGRFGEPSDGTGGQIPPVLHEAWRFGPKPSIGPIADVSRCAVNAGPALGLAPGG